jgi:hypothetical protein
LKGGKYELLLSSKQHRTSNAVVGSALNTAADESKKRGILELLQQIPDDDSNKRAMIVLGQLIRQNE